VFHIFILLIVTIHLFGCCNSIVISVSSFMMCQNDTLIIIFVANVLLNVCGSFLLCIISLDDVTDDGTGYLLITLYNVNHRNKQHQACIIKHEDYKLKSLNFKIIFVSTIFAK